MSDERRPGQGPDDFFNGSPAFAVGDDAIPGEDPQRAARRRERERQRTERAAKSAGKGKRDLRRFRRDRPPRDGDVFTNAPIPPSGPRFRARTLKRAAIAAAAIVLLVVGAAYAMRAIYSGQALPGTTVAGVDVGGRSPAEIERAIATLADPERRLTLRGPGRERLRVSAGGAGMQPDISGTVDDALDARRDGILAPLRSLFDGADVPLHASIDEAQLTSAVKRAAAEFDRSPYAGALQIDPDTRVVTTEPAKDGREVAQGDLRERLRLALLHPGRGAGVAVPMRTARAVSEARLRSVAEDAERYLRAPLRLTGAGKTYVVEPAKLAPLLALEPLDEGRKARLGVDAKAVAALVARVAAARDRAARSARISAPASGPRLAEKGRVSWTPRKAEVSVTAEGRSGRAVRQAELEQAIAKAVRADRHEVEVPVTTTKAPVTRAQARKVDSVIGTFWTAYVAGQPRVSNIQRMARSVDGTIVAPGEQFSLNAITGERTKAKGYVEAPFIAGNKIEPSVGGGVSQFATTIYNAAYFAGLELDAWQAHSLYIDRYPPGRESTLNFPTIDVKWTNDTGAPVLIRTAYDSGGVSVTLYGDNGGRRVTAIPGERQPNPGGNFIITVTRVVTYADGRKVRQPVTTRYANEEKDPAGND